MLSSMLDITTDIINYIYWLIAQVQQGTFRIGL